MLQKDVIPTSKGNLEITFLTHGSLLMTWGGLVIYTDPIAEGGPDYAKLPKADVLLLTHDHYDHLDSQVVGKIKKSETAIMYNMKCAPKCPGGAIMKNGETRTVQGITVEAVPAYNIKHMKAPGQPFHPKGEGNGYIVTFGDKRVYIAGDTENIPEMKTIKAIDVAFLPMNLPYTMTPEMVADAAKAFRPKILYPYHMGETDASRLTALLKDEKGIEVRIRDLR